MMTIEQIQKVLHESLSLEFPYQEIRVLGGEPTRHPELSTIVMLLDWYRLQVDECSISLWTHVYGERVKQKLKALPEWMRIRISGKEPGIYQKGFESFLVAPADYLDISPEKYRNGCKHIAPDKLCMSSCCGY